MSKDLIKDYIDELFTNEGLEPTGEFYQSMIAWSQLNENSMDSEDLYSVLEYSFQEGVLPDAE